MLDAVLLRAGLGRSDVGEVVPWVGEGRGELGAVPLDVVE